MFLDDLMEKDGFAVSRRSFLRFLSRRLGGRPLATGMLSPWRSARADDDTDKEKKYTPGKTTSIPGSGRRSRAAARRRP